MQDSKNKPKNSKKKRRRIICIENIRVKYPVAKTKGH